MLHDYSVTRLHAETPTRTRGRTRTRKSADLRRSAAESFPYSAQRESADCLTFVRASNGAQVTEYEGSRINASVASPDALPACWCRFIA